MVYPEDNLDFQIAWARAVGRLNSINKIVVRLNDRAANCYINRNDNAADNLREMATTFSREASKIMGELDEFTREANKRNSLVYIQQPGHPAVVRYVKREEES